jgi:sulfatase modifying factor 1
MVNSRAVIGQIAFLVIVATLTAFGTAQSQGAPGRVAVLDFHDSSTGRATPEEVLYLSDLVRGVARRVLPAERYLLMTRENIQEMLPQGRTLADCVGECAVETGRKLGVDYVVTGEVTSFGGQIRVTVNLHGMKTGNLIDQVRAGAPNVLGVEKDLEEQARALLLKLRVPASSDAAAPDPGVARGNTTPEPWSATGSTRVVVSFTSEPAGAIVEIDGQPLGETPCKRALATGVYQLGLKKVRYVAHEQSLEVRAGVPPTIAVTLTPDFGWLTVESDPHGLSVTVDGEDWDATPVQAREVGTGPHDIQVGSVNHYVESRSIVIERGEHESVRMAPVPRNGGLTVSATDAAGSAVDAGVLVDGNEVGRAYQPLTVIQGNHQISVVGPVGAWKGEVTITEKQMRELAVQLSVMSAVVKLVEIPAGSFIMREGSNRYDHPVEITRSFYMSATEVTQAQYQQVMGGNPSKFNGADLPVEEVSWLEAVQFCNKLSKREGLKPAYRVNDDEVTWDCMAPGYRLPTEAEWEYACRAGTSTDYNTGSGEANLDRAGWYRKNAGGRTHPVGNKAPNAWGLYDMHGNVEEWCWDRQWKWAYDGEYDTTSQRDPQGPTNDSERVIRGGDWDSDEEQCRTYNSRGNEPSFASPLRGFRVARSSPR